MTDLVAQCSDPVTYIYLAATYLAVRTRAGVLTSDVNDPETSLRWSAGLDPHGHGEKTMWWRVEKDKERRD